LIRDRSDLTLSAPTRWRATAALVQGLIAAALVVVGCADIGPPSPRQQPITAAQVGLSGDLATLAVASRWWQDFGDPQLDALIARAVADGPDLHAAQARLAHAEANAKGAEAGTQMQLGAVGSATRQRFPDHGLYPPPIAGSIRNSADLALHASFEFDFFGRHRAAIAAAVGAQHAAAAEVAAARLVISVAVAQSYFALAQALAQQDLAAQALGLREQAGRMANERAQAGLDSQFEARQAEAAIAQARQPVAAAAEAVLRSRNALAALTVQGVAQLSGLQPRLADADAAAAPAALPVHLGADLIARRADLSAARWRIVAADAGVAEAKAGFYPDVNLSAFAGLSSFGLDRLLEVGSRSVGVGPALHLPIFDGGALRARLHGREADHAAAVAAYDAVLLRAVHEAADAIAALASTANQQADAADALTALQAAQAIAQRRWQAGIAARLPVIVAAGQVLAQRTLAVDLVARRRLAQLQLIAALGGGYAEKPDALAAR
jgi:NodT family efflux transporter outer membrane factor (OMF) lipoprotein